MALEDFLVNPLGLAALAGLIPLIIVYLIRPKPKQETIPSLMFLMKKHGQSLTSSFFQRLLYNMLLLLQVLVISLIALTLAEPFVLVSEASILGHTIIVIDASASMSAGTRMQEAKDFAISQLGGVNSIVLAKDVPEIILTDGSGAEAAALINNIIPVSTVTNLYDAIKTAETLVKDKSKIVIASDFIDTASPSSYETAIRFLRTQGHVVSIKSVYRPITNVGIIDLVVNFPKSSVTIKNYEQDIRPIKLIIGEFSKEFVLSPGDVKTIDFDTPLGLNKLIIESNDEFKADNVVYIATPNEEKIRVLLITNDPNPYLLAALEENKEIDVSIAQPPTILNYNFDVIILGNVDPQKLLPGTIKAVIDNVHDGRAGIVTAHTNLNKIDYQGMFSPGEKRTGTVSSIHQITQDINFGAEDYIYTTSGNPLAKSENDEIVISFTEIGNGKLLYYGIRDELSGFKFRLKYPVFWKDIINFLLNRKNINEINTKTGKILTFESPLTVATPTERLNTDKVVFEHSGFYDFGNYKMAANLLDFKESEVDKEVLIEESLAEVIGSKAETPLTLSSHILLLLMILVGLELIYLKYRGDI